MPRALHTKPFAWDQRSPILPVWKKLVATPEKAPKAAAEKKPAGIALIAGYNSGSDSEDNDEEEEAAKQPAEAPKAGSKRKMTIQVKARAKAAKTADVASIFREGNDEDGDRQQERQQQPKPEAKRDKHGRKIYGTATGKSTICNHYRVIQLV